jgi:hypothetical protein
MLDLIVQKFDKQRTLKLFALVVDITSPLLVQLPGAPVVDCAKKVAD